MFFLGSFLSSAFYFFLNDKDVSPQSCERSRRSEMLGLNAFRCEFRRKNEKEGTNLKVVG